MTNNRIIDKRQDNSWMMKSMVFNNWMKNLNNKFSKKEVSHIGPYKNLEGETLIRVIYVNGMKPEFFTIPSNLDMNPSDWEYLESQIRENIPQYAD